MFSALAINAVCIPFQLVFIAAMFLVVWDCILFRLVFVVFTICPYFVVVFCWILLNAPLTLVVIPVILVFAVKFMSVNAAEVCISVLFAIYEIWSKPVWNWDKSSTDKPPKPNCGLKLEANVSPNIYA